jgi:hypothetical protein
VSISQVSWHGPHSFVLTDSCPPKPGPLDVSESSQATRIGLHILGTHPARAPVTFRLHVPLGLRVEVAIFDLAGRRVRTLLDGVLPAGDGEVRWDGLGGQGEAPGVGVYFARLSSAGGQRVAKLVLLQ